jgi:hypothetical protein
VRVAGLVGAGACRCRAPRASAPGVAGWPAFATAAYNTSDRSAADGSAALRRISGLRDTALLLELEGDLILFLEQPLKVVLGLEVLLADSAVMELVARRIEVGERKLSVALRGHFECLGWRARSSRDDEDRGGRNRRTTTTTRKAGRRRNVARGHSSLDRHRTRRRG